MHPEEKTENLLEINRLIFSESEDGDDVPDVLIVLGSRNCEYKIQRAWEIGQRHPGVLYIVSGGNISAYNGMTEAEYIASWLMKCGVCLSDICLENRAKFTRQNLEFSARILSMLRAKSGKSLSKICILTSGFHILRTKLLAAQIPVLNRENLRWIAAYSPHGYPDNWFDDPIRRDIILQELRKTVMLKGAENWDGKE